MNILERLKYLFTSGPEIDMLIAEKRRARLKKEVEDNAHRLNLCLKHRQEQNHSHFSSNNCHYCQLQNQFEYALEERNYWKERSKGPSL